MHKLNFVALLLVNLVVVNPSFAAKDSPVTKLGTCYDLVKTIVKDGTPSKLSVSPGQAYPRFPEVGQGDSAVYCAAGDVGMSTSESASEYACLDKRNGNFFRFQSDAFDHSGDYLFNAGGKTLQEYTQKAASEAPATPSTTN